MFRSWIDDLTIPVWSPLHRRAWHVSPRQYRLLVLLFSGRRFTVRELAAESGYSVHGVHRAIESLVSGGLLVKRTIRGCKGWTWARVRAGAHALRANVPERERRTTSAQPESVADTLGNILAGLPLAPRPAPTPEAVG